MEEIRNKYGRTEKESVKYIFLYIQKIIKSMDEAEKIYNELLDPELKELFSMCEKKIELESADILIEMFEELLYRKNNLFTDNNSHKLI